MPGGKTAAAGVRHLVTGYSNAAVTASLYLVEDIIPFPTHITAVKVYASTAGTGAGNTLVDVLLNVTTIWTTAGNRPTLAATSTGEFANTRPDARQVDSGDRIAIQVASVSTTGHARLSASVVLEDAVTRATRGDSL